jgi:hypothetical protein
VLSVEESTTLLAVYFSVTRYYLDSYSYSFKKARWLLHKAVMLCNDLELERGDYHVPKNSTLLVQ